MKLLDLHIQGFGKFKDQTISFEDGLNVIYGKNEAGKSTIHTFIRGMLYGIERGRGRAAKNDLYSKYEPWTDRQTYEGVLRVESQGMVYRIERNFQKNNKGLTVINETMGREEEPTKALFDQLTCGLSETAYNNTISIGQLKSATDEGMVSELKNHIANLNTTGNMSLDITKATDFLKKQKKALEAQTEPEAARTYTALVSEIRNMEKEISSPQYENQLPEYRKTQETVKAAMIQKQEEKEALLQKVAKAKQILAASQFTTPDSIASYQKEAKDLYESCLKGQIACNKKSRTVLFVFLLVIGSLLLGGGGALLILGITNSQIVMNSQVNFVAAGCGVLVFAFLCYLASLLLYKQSKRHKVNLEENEKTLKEILGRHLGDAAISEEAMSALYKRLDEYTKLSDVSSRSEAAIEQLVKEIQELHEKQENCSAFIEQQQKVQWELEQKLEKLAEYKNQAESYKSVLAENEHLREEISAIDLALETMTDLSASIRDSFGLYLNKTASSLISGITGGIYNSMSVDENLNAWLNTRNKLIPIDQVSSGTMDQVYLALRLAAAKLIQNNMDEMPIMFDDSFIQYDDERLRSALKWLSRAYHGQLIVFTCHQREAQMLTANQIPYHFIHLN